MMLLAASFLLPKKLQLKTKVAAIRPTAANALTRFLVFAQAKNPNAALSVILSTADTIMAAQVAAVLVAADFKPKAVVASIAPLQLQLLLVLL